MNLRDLTSGHRREAVVCDGRVLVDALRRERRHAAVSYLAAGMALGIAFSLALDMAIAAAARV